MNPIELEISYETVEEVKLKELGITESSCVKDSKAKTVTFYRIDAVGIFTDVDGNEYGVIYTDGSSFVTFKTYEEVNKLIKSNNP